MKESAPNQSKTFALRIDPVFRRASSFSREAKEKSQKLLAFANSKRKTLRCLMLHSFPLGL